MPPTALDRSGFRPTGDDVGALYPAPAVSAAALRALAVQAGSDVAPGVAEGTTGVLRIGFVDCRFEGTAIDPRIAAAVRRVAHTLEQDLGHAVEPARIPIPTSEIVANVIRIVTCWTAAGIEAFCRSRGIDLTGLPDDALEPATWGALRAGRQTSASEYIALLGTANRIARAVGAALDGFDVVITPVLAEPAAPIGRFAMNNPDYLDYRLGADGLVHYSPFTPLANLTGQPALSLPLAMIDDLPVGIQLIGRTGREVQLLALSARLEQLMPWADRRPPCCDC